MQPRLIGLRGPAIGLSINLSPTETTLGREVGNSLVLNSSSVSRRHARIIPQGAAFVIEDLGSANGVRVNGLSISGPTLLKNGDHIDLGEVGLLFESPEAAPAAMQPSPKKPEMSSAERATQTPGFAPPSRMGSDAPGCDPFGNLLNDLSGCLPALMKYLIPILIALAVLFCLGALLMFGFGAITGALSGLSHGGSQSAPAGGGTAPGQNQPPPPPANNPPDNPQEETQNAKITVLSTRVIRVVGADQRKTPTLLVKWRNDSDQPVTELDGTVIIHLQDGHTDAYPKLKIYVGAPVQPGQTHEDKGDSDGVMIATDVDPQPEVVPTLVK